MVKKLGILAWLAGLLLSACSPATAVEVVRTVMVEKEAAAPAEKVVEQEAAAELEVEKQAAAAEASGEKSASGVNQLAYAPVLNRMVIKDAVVNLLVEDTDRAAERLLDMTATLGGYVISSRTWYEHDYKQAEFKLGIPSNNFEKAMNDIRRMGLKVMDENASGQDVSAEYVDLQSRLTNLEATTARVREFLADAKTVEESLKINGQLSELEAQIEQVKGQMRFYEGRAAFSTITVVLAPQYPTPTPTLTPTSTLTPTTTPTITPTPGWKPGETFREAANISSALIRGTIDLFIWIGVVFGPFIVVLGLLAWGFFRVWRLFKRQAAKPTPASATQPYESGKPE